MLLQANNPAETGNWRMDHLCIENVDSINITMKREILKIR